MFRKSSFSGPQGNCVEVEIGPGAVFVRDSKQADAPTRSVLMFSHETWRAFLNDEDSDVQHEIAGRHVAMTNRRERREPAGVQQVLRFTRDEWFAFRDGVNAGEFDIPPRARFLAEAAGHTK